MKQLADVSYPIFRGIGSLGFEVEPINQLSALFKFVKIISNTIGVLTISAGLWFVFQLLGGAIQWLSSGGEKQSLQNAQKRIVNALIGLVIVVLSYAIISIIGQILGFDILDVAFQVLKLAP
jgi:hypothetical protein